MRNILNRASWSFVFVGLLLASMILAGCGGGGGGTPTQTTINPYNGLKYSANALTLGTVQGTLALNVGPATISGSLIVVTPASAKGGSGATRPATVKAGTYSFSATFTGSSPKFTAPFTNLSNSTISGTMPTAPATTGGSFNLTLTGTAYGPFPFGTTTTTTVSFTVNEIGTLAPGGYSNPLDLNDNGEVVGSATDASDISHAFSWTKTGGLVDLGLFGAVNGNGASAAGVNNGGTVVGVYGFTPGSGQGEAKPFIAGLPAFGAPPGCDSVQFQGILNSGQMFVEGYVFGGDSENALGSFAYVGGKYQPIGITSSTGTSMIRVFGKNVVFGAYGGDTIPPPGVNFWKWDGTTSAAFDWNALYMSHLSTWRGVGANGEAFGILTNGHAGFVSANGSVVTDTGHAGEVFGVNASGQAVGNYTDGTVGQRGFYWTKTGGFKDLNTMIDSSLGITIFGAGGINAKGQIMCGTYNKSITSSPFGVGALLTPN